MTVGGHRWLPATSQPRTRALSQTTVFENPDWSPETLWTDDTERRAGLPRSSSRLGSCAPCLNRAAHPDMGIGSVVGGRLYDLFRNPPRGPSMEVGLRPWFSRSG